MKRTASLCLLLACIAVAGCRRAATTQSTTQPTTPSAQAAQTAAQPQLTVCVAENMSRAALLQQAASPTPKPQPSPVSKR